MTAPNRRAEVAELLDGLIVRATRDAIDAPTRTAEDCAYAVGLLAIAEGAASVAVLLDALAPNSTPGASESVPAPRRLPSNPYE
ncbi:hypothetical protein [Nocardia cyriacigeorgica]|uniref:hypothetical protein n=1 Tax=Nocardia cyriacigeorgica TaxID=135487 RepID=UPI001895F026|nr:hypothetical protein [Nocardia cyriacigeorgica]MBF6289272.1 hypothetical protein [Nocardia cyriacigeorgica]